MHSINVWILGLLAATFAAHGQGGDNGATRAASAAPETLPGGIPNRTLPVFEPPKAELEFSANPTVQEIFRARVFEEPLVPIGGVPNDPENAALASALLGYAKRGGPDDFSSITTFFAGDVVDGPLTNAATAVSNGLFTVTLDKQVEAASERAEGRMRQLEAENAEMKARLEKLETLLDGRSNGGAK